MGEALPRPTGPRVLGAKARGGGRGSPLAAASAPPRPCPALCCEGSSGLLLLPPRSGPPSGLPPLRSSPPLNYHDSPNLCASKRLLGPQTCSPPAVTAPPRQIQRPPTASNSFNTQAGSGSSGCPPPCTDPVAPGAAPRTTAVREKAKFCPHPWLPAAPGSSLLQPPLQLCSRLPPQFQPPLSFPASSLVPLQSIHAWLAGEGLKHGQCH